MSIKSDRWIREQAHQGMIVPFTDKLETENVISYGVSSYGYDARVSNEFKIFKKGVVLGGEPMTWVDPKQFENKNTIELKTDHPFLLPANSFCLAHTIESFKIPRDVLVVCVGKSTYARCGLIVNVTPLEPEWEGQVTLEFSNTTQQPIRIYPNEGICQFLFFQSNEPCELSYGDRKGKYQHQKGITLPKVSET